MTNDEGTPEPPPDLNAEALRVWNDSHADFLMSTAERALLGQVCRAISEIELLQQAMASTGGPIVLDRFGQAREHPSISAMARHRSFISTALGRLGFQVQPEPTASQRALGGRASAASWKARR